MIQILHVDAYTSEKMAPCARNAYCARTSEGVQAPPPSAAVLASLAGPPRLRDVKVDDPDPRPWRRVETRFESRAARRMYIVQQACSERPTHASCCRLPMLVRPHKDIILSILSTHTNDKTNRLSEPWDHLHLVSSQVQEGGDRDDSNIPPVCLSHLRPHQRPRVISWSLTRKPFKLARSLLEPRTRSITVLICHPDFPW